MRVSVVIPLYNKQEYIARSVNSVLSQSFGDFELIIVDDGSTDESLRIAREFRDNRIKILTQKNAGPGAARNTGINHAAADLIAFLDADDEWMPEYLLRSLKILDAHPNICAAVSGYFECDPSHSTEKMWQKRGITQGIVRIEPGDAPISVVHKLAYMSCWSTVVRKQALIKWGGFYAEDRCTYAEDSFLWLKLLMNENVYFNTAPLVCYHREASELTRFTGTGRPVEPFLLKPHLIQQDCPEKLRPLLSKILAIRAYKTCCVLGYFGEWRSARRLFSKFYRPGFWYLPYFSRTMLFSTAAGGFLGRTARSALKMRRASRFDLPPKRDISFVRRGVL